MQEDLFGVADIDSVIKKKKRKPLNIHLVLSKVCIGSKTFQCRTIPYSPNFLNRKHWAVKAAWKKAWEEEIWGRWQEEKKNWKEYKFPMLDKAKIVISVFCIRKQDEDNAMASMKGVIDGLVKSGIIKNDDYNCLTSSVQFVPVKTRIAEHIEIHIKKYIRK